MSKSVAKSRRKTPWDGTPRDATQEFLYTHYLDHYRQRHPTLGQAGEADLVNSFAPDACPFCGSTLIFKKGHDRNGIQRYFCRSCEQQFRPTTGTIFDSRRIPISEWMEYCLNIFRYVSLNADSWNNRNAFSTSKYWLEKLFLTLEHYQDECILNGIVWLDETYYSVVMSDRIRDANGRFLRGLSTNQICIGVATDGNRLFCRVEGFGKPSQKKTSEAFRDHILPGSILVHDKETTHKKLVSELNLLSVDLKASQLKGLPDDENPLYPVNHAHFLLKRFLNAHSGFTRSELDGYLNLFAFVMNPPSDPLEKVETIIKMAFENPKLLRYRKAFRKNQGP